MRSIVRAAAYRPLGTVDGRSIAAWDEDLFTLIATAAERAAGAGVDPAPSLDILLTADLPASQERDLPLALGLPTTLTRYPATGEGLVAALEAARGGDSGDALVLGAEVPMAHDGMHPSGSGDGAVAFRLSATERSPAERPFDVRSVGAARSVLDAALALSGSVTDRSRWIGDWGPRPSSEPLPAPSQVRGGEGGSRPDISEGAYIPAPRYRESLPARWRFAADRCARCASITFPPRGRCRACGSTEPLVRFELPRHDLEVVATTSIGPGGQPTEFDDLVAERGPYEVLIAELATGVRVTLQVADAPAGSLHIGDRVDTRLGRLYRMDGEWRYGRKAIPRRIL
jgi:uncharacterized OB-fold protein